MKGARMGAAAQGQKKSQQKRDKLLKDNKEKAKKML